MAARRKKTGGAVKGRTVDPREIARFDAQAARWWDPKGEMRALHAINPIRIDYLRERLARHFGKNPVSPRPLAGLRILDIGCGGGLLTEALAKLGARMTGVDMAEDALAIAKSHAKASKLATDYRASDIETVAESGATFDAVVAMEIVEHVADLPAFLEAAARCVRPGGALALSTLNRTAKSFLLGIVAAEYVLRLVPQGTHDWKKFVRPSELARHLRAAGLSVEDKSGIAVDPFTGRFRLVRDLGVNYLAFAIRP
jgi:2-polyprenyl-6-hydroxyphenyl methylase/3-demethylubiquinone-9 3-methyltransferase